jgi:hypothetical protein
LEQQQRVFGGREDRRATLLEAINDEYFQKQVNSDAITITLQHHNRNSPTP